jgi:hypothetical protein
MIELNNDGLVFSFDEVHENARFSIDFQRTLRIPDDGKSYALPPGLGRFPIRHVDDFAERVPEAWRRHGGVMLPMYQAEALWLHFGGGGGGVFYGSGGYPFAVKVATGRINAVNGEAWADGLNRDPQDYMVVPNQPWLDGYCVEKGLIRQFVAMPLGAGYSVEEQLTGEAEFGGIQVVAYPMKRKAYERRFRSVERGIRYSLADEQVMMARPAAAPDMGLAPGGRMRQEIYDDPYELSDWDLRHGSRCFVHLANALVWRAITGEDPPTTPPTAEEYTRAGLPWFEYYGGDQKALGGAGPLKGLLSVLQMGKKKGDVPLPENDSVDPANVVKLGKAGVVREGTF